MWQIRGARSDLDVERDVTIVIKTFERPAALLRLVGSIRRLYPRIRVYVVDDSAQPLDPVPEGVTRYWHLPFHVGVGHGRNFGLAQVDTEYVVLADDDLVFKRRTNLTKMARALRSTRFDIVSCRWVDHDLHDVSVGACRGVRHFEGTIEIEEGMYMHRFRATRGEIDGLPIFDVVHNFFIGTRERLGENPWDPWLKTNEHSDFFLRMRARGLLATRLPDVFVYHYPMLVPRYAPYRRDTASYDEYWRRKLGTRGEVFVGRQFDRRDLFLRRYPSKSACTVRRAARVTKRLLREGHLRAATRHLTDGGRG